MSGQTSKGLGTRIIIKVSPTLTLGLENVERLQVCLDAVQLETSGGDYETGDPQNFRCATPVDVARAVLESSEYEDGVRVLTFDIDRGRRNSISLEPTDQQRLALDSRLTLSSFFDSRRGAEEGFEPSLFD